MSETRWNNTRQKAISDCNQRKPHVKSAGHISDNGRAMGKKRPKRHHYESTIRWRRWREMGYNKYLAYKITKTRRSGPSQSLQYSHCNNFFHKFNDVLLRKFRVQMLRITSRLTYPLLSGSSFLVLFPSSWNRIQNVGRIWIKYILSTTGIKTESRL